MFNPRSGCNILTECVPLKNRSTVETPGADSDTEFATLSD